MAHLLFTRKVSGRRLLIGLNTALVLIGAVTAAAFSFRLGSVLVLIGLYHLARALAPRHAGKMLTRSANIFLAVLAAWVLAAYWAPLGPEKGTVRNFIFVAILIGGLLLMIGLYQRAYRPILRWCLGHKALFLCFPLLIVLFGGMAWLGFERLFGWLPRAVKTQPAVAAFAHQFPGFGKEFMPPLDEGSFLLMPTTMPHASIGEALEVLQKQDMAIRMIPEVDTAVGKIGRAETPLDPAPVSMIETIINYKSEYVTDKSGRRLTFRFDPEEEDLFRSEKGDPLPARDGLTYKVRGLFERDAGGKLIPDPDGRPFRLWRPPLDPDLNPGREAWAGIRTPDDIWQEILAAAEIPGTTSAPKLQPIAARIVMLQSGMRAPMGIKIKGPSLEAIEEMGLQLERLLKAVPSVEPATVIADRIVGKPYLEIHIDRQAIARYGIMLNQVQELIEVAVGGKRITTTVEGRARYPVRVRYLRELRDSIEALQKILVSAPDGTQIPLGQLSRTEYVRGPQMIKSEDTFLVGYVLFDMKPGRAEVDVVEQARAYLDGQIETGRLRVPQGVSYTFAGSYENQVRSEKKLMVVLPLALFIIFMILYFQFKSIPTTLLVFSRILVAWSGGLILIWLYGRPGFMDFSLLGISMRELFQIQPINLSVAVWVGFLALFGIATDDGVIMCTYLEQKFLRKKMAGVDEIREAVIEASRRRVRPALMTVATTLLALIPVLTATGRGADIMVPMAIPTFGGMAVVMLTIFVVPVLYCAMKEFRFRREKKGARS
jgi:Cu(I)/Ag(I) efflux system membrane protein CusA/SilA